MRRVILGIAAVLLLGLGVLFLPPVADHFGYARPIPTGLPSRFSIFDYELYYHPGCDLPLRHGRCTDVRGLNASLPRCPTRDYLHRHQYWPLQEIGTIPTLFGPAHRVYDILAAYSIGPPFGLYLVQDGSCYLPYSPIPT